MIPVTWDEPMIFMTNHALCSNHLLAILLEMKRNKSFALCCGAGGAQMFKEAEKGNKEVFIERIEDALETGAAVIATACPFCMTMMTDGLKYKNKEEEVKNYDIAELIAMDLDLLERRFDNPSLLICLK